MTQQQKPWERRTFDRRNDMISYPFIQWINRGSTLNPRSERGGPAMPLSEAAVLGFNIPGQVVNIHHKSGETTEAIFAQSLRMAVLGQRFTWVKDGNRLPAYDHGARSKLQVVGYVAGSDGQIGLAMLTLKGLVTKAFNEAHRRFARAVRKATNGRAPSYAFWMEMEPGEPTMVGQHEQSLITPLTWAGELAPETAYIGDAAIDAIPWEEIDAWQGTWETSGPNGEGEIPDVDEADDDATATSRPIPTIDLETAQTFPLPFEAKAQPQGTALNKLGDTELAKLCNMQRYPDAAEAARVVLTHRVQQRRAEQTPRSPF